MYPRLATHARITPVESRDDGWSTRRSGAHSCAHHRQAQLHPHNTIMDNIPAMAVVFGAVVLMGTLPAAIDRLYYGHVCSHRGCGSCCVAGAHALMATPHFSPAASFSIASTERWRIATDAFSAKTKHERERLRRRRSAAGPHRQRRRRRRTAQPTPTASVLATGGANERAHAHLPCRVCLLLPTGGHWTVLRRHRLPGV